MENVEVKPINGKNKPSIIEVFPDTGCQQSIVSEDLIDACGLILDRSKRKKITAVDGGEVPCTGSTTFQATYHERTTNVLALVTPALSGEVILSWRALQRLGVIPMDFPSPRSNQHDHVTLNKMFAPLPLSKSRNIKKEKLEAKKSLKTTADDAIDLHESVDELKKKYNSVFAIDAELKTMTGEPMKIDLVDNMTIKPLHVNVPRRTPYAYQKVAKEELDRLVALGVLEEVSGSSEWISPMSFVPKPDGTVRLVADFVHLNKYVKRPVHPFDSPRDILAKIDADAKHFAVFDAKSGYWQIPLDEKSKELTTFITEWGLFRYRRAPMGLTSSGDEFCSRTDHALAGITGMYKLVDDILVFGSTKNELLKRIGEVFQRCKDHRITLSSSKQQLGSEVTFAGHVVSAQGTKPDPAKIAAIKDFPEPKNITDLRSFLGLANQFGDYAPDLRHAMEPLKPLLQKKNVYTWSNDHTIAMNNVKAIITGPQCLQRFDPKLPIVLLTDASRTGLGFVLIQTEVKPEAKDDDALADAVTKHTAKKIPKGRLVSCGSRFLSSAEANYAVIELELLAIQWAIAKSRLYLAGANFTVITDHQPLVGVLNGKNMDAINNLRIHRIMSKLIGYQFRVLWTPGKTHHIADALSRCPVFQPEDQDDVLVCSVLVGRGNVTEEATEPDPALKRLVQHTTNDKDYQKVYMAVKDHKKLNDLPKDHPALHYRSYWHAMSLEQTLPRLVFYHGRVMVPRAAKKEVMDTLHMQHCGENKTLANARQLYFWAGMSDDIKQMISRCQEYITHLPSIKNSMVIRSWSISFV